MKEVKCEGLQATVVQRAAENNFKSVLFAIINCSETESLAREVFKMKIATECRNYAKQRSTFFFCSSAAIHFLYSSFKQSILGMLSRALTIAASPKLKAAGSEFSRRLGSDTLCSSIMLLSVTQKNLVLCPKLCSKNIA